jgi:aminoglycoside phosphotransferase (APT) family kinase protein
VARWQAELQVDAELARTVIRSQFPELTVDSVVPLSEGWDYAVFRVDGEWAFRFPRRQVVVGGTERELVALPLLAPLLPVAVPAPVYVGRPAAEFPWPFYGAQFLPGAEPGPSLSDDARTRLARPLARFLRTLHAGEAFAVVGHLLPVDLMGRGDPQVRVPKTRAALEAIAHLWTVPPEAEELFERALGLPPVEPVAICHGDLHFRQLLIDREELSGVVDWVDVCRGDPGLDLTIAWSFLSSRARVEFLDEYGPVSEGSELRARLLALNLMAILADWARSSGLREALAEALAGLERALG